MTGNDIYNSALARLGYGDSPRFRQRALSTVNQVYADIWYCVSKKPFVPLRSLSESIPLSERILYDIMPAGVAAFISQSESDGDAQQLWVHIYNQKRAGLTHFECRADGV